jgi:hypothetical protein
LGQRVRADAPCRGRDRRGLGATMPSPDEKARHRRLGRAVAVAMKKGGSFSACCEPRQSHSVSARNIVAGDDLMGAHVMVLCPGVWSPPVSLRLLAWPLQTRPWPRPPYCGGRLVGSLSRLFLPNDRAGGFSRSSLRACALDCAPVSPGSTFGPKKPLTFSRPGLCWPGRVRSAPVAFCLRDGSRGRGFSARSQS